MNRNACLLAVLLTLSTASFGQVIDSLQSVLDTARNESKVKTLNEMFRAHLDSDPVKAIAYSRQALELAIEIGDKKGIGASYNNLGVAYRIQGGLDQSLEYYLTALKIYEELENKEGIATLKNNISNIYSMKKEYGPAMKYLEDSYALLVELDDKTRIVGSMNNLGNLNMELQLYEKAMKNFTQSFQLSQQIGRPFADPVNNVGNIYFRQGNYQKAIEAYLQALEIEKTDNNRVGILNTSINLGMAYSKSGQAKEAQRYLSEARSLAEEMQAFSYMPPILKYNAELLYKQGNHKAAYETMMKYDSLREKIYGEESTKKIAQMEMVQDFQQQEKELQMLKKEDEIKTLQLRNSRLFIVMVILIVLVVLGVINFYFMGSNRKKLFKRTF